jgi:hypothetical protein
LTFFGNFSVKKTGTHRGGLIAQALWPSVDNRVKHIRGHKKKTTSIKKDRSFKIKEECEFLSEDLTSFQCFGTILCVIEELLGKRKMFDLPKID